MTARGYALGLVSSAVPGALFSAGVLFSYGYASQLVYTIGDTRQLVPLFLGIILGSTLFSLVGYLVRSTYQVLAAETAAASLLLVVSYGVMAASAFVLDGTLVFLVSLAMTSALAPIGTILRLNRRVHSVAARATFGVAQAALTILLVFAFAFYYETHGQIGFFVYPLALFSLSIAASLALLRAR